MKLKAWLTFLITICSTSWMGAASWLAPLDVYEQELVYLFGTEWPELSEDQAWVAWGLWSFGVIMGTGTSLT